MSELRLGDGGGKIDSVAQGAKESQSRLSMEALQVSIPGNALNRVGSAAAEALNPVNLVGGIGNALVYDYQHPAEVVKILGSSALIGATLKTVLPESGPAGKAAAAAVGAYFFYQSVKPFGQAIAAAAGAESMQDIHNAARDMDNIAGSFAVNSLIGAAGARLGSRAADYVLKSEALDGFADLKSNFWSKVNNTVAGSPGEAAGVQAGSVFMRPLYRMDGERATVLPADRPLEAGRLIGESDPNATMDVSLYIKSKASPLTMERAIERVASGRSDYSDPRVFAEKFGADPAAIIQVKNFAEQTGLTISELNPDSGRAVLSGRAGDIGRAFGTRIGDYEAPGGKVFRAQTGSFSLPSEFAEKVNGIAGLEQPVPARSSAAGNGVFSSDSYQSASTPERLKYMPQDVAKLYNFPMETGGKGQGVAIISLEGGLDLVENSKYYAEHGIPEPKINIISVDFAKNDPRISADDPEIHIDSQIVGAVAPRAVQNIIFAPNTERGIIDSIHRAIFQPAGEAPNASVSISYGLPESQTSPQWASAMREMVQKAVLKGINVYAASGDRGAHGQAIDGSIQVELPASIPEVIACGGTRLVGKEGRIVSETSWNEGRDDFGELWSSGGGISSRFEVPEWQKDLALPENINTTGKTGRAMPDVSGNASFDSGYIIRVNGRTRVLGGTSAVAPLYNALNALLNAELGGKSVGWLQPVFYKLGKAGSPVFRDITEGNNGGYNAGKGWDAVTGWGSIDGGKLLEALKE